ncbi:SHC-transforming protein 1 isoform X1 [Strongylocentrotus purpuratus]|uniref:SHC-transforming protein 1 n=1 Tax=Strongylocentrotus purpuratus TaxID=7668 RepID=A0A7M7SUF1_STRPU|nr:SHC-transforming protein 1 isoform X1 [Strongylocentrotus purpuratus]
MAGVMSHFKKNKGPNMVGQRSNEELWTRTGTFINKPTRGWLHIEEELKDHGGVCYGVRYVGCVEVKQSMRTLPFEMRGQVTKEAIFRICDAAGFKYTRKKKASKTICKIIGENPNILFGGANVNLTISTASINIRIKETGKPIANHQMQGISFASGGDAETQNYVAYVAKDPVNGRACHVLECLAGLAQDVITTVGQAFEIRFKDYLRNPPQVFSTPDRMEEPLFHEGESAWGDDPDYYNDISKLNVNLPDRGVPPPPSGQYMPTSPTRHQPYTELLGQQGSGGSSPVGPPPGYTANPPPYFDSNHPSNSSQASSNPRGPQGATPGHQPMTGRLIDIDSEPPIYGATASPSRNNGPTALDNPLQRSSRHTSSSSSHLSPQHSPTHNNNIKKPSRKAKRRTPSLYDNPPTKEDVEAKVKQLTPAERNQYQNIIANPDWKKLVDSGYDNLRMLNVWKQSKSVMLHKGGDQEGEYANVACFHDDHDDDDDDDEHGNRNDGEEEEEEEVDDALGSMMYDDQRPVSANYDNPQSPKFSDRKMTEAAYNASLPNHPLNLEVGQQLQRATSNGDQHSIDPFDMEPFNPEAAKQPSNPSAGGGGGASGLHPHDMAPPTNPLYNEEWFHGPMSRKEGEPLLSNDGDFLVRESTTAKDQYVLSGMQNGTPKHLLLVDPQGKVRTKDKEFDSVSHLINYHRNNRLPIISAGSAVHLKTPVVRKFKT